MIRQIPTSHEIEDFDVDPTPAKAIARQMRDKTADDVRRAKESEPPTRKEIAALEQELERELGELPKTYSATLALRKRLEQVVPKDRTETLKLRHALELVKAHQFAIQQMPPAPIVGGDDYNSELRSPEYLLTLDSDRARLARQLGSR